MTQIKELTINTSPIPRAQTVRSYNVLGDTGACFTVVVKNEDNNFYKHQSEVAKNNYNIFFGEKEYIYNMKEVMNEIN